MRKCIQSSARWCGKHNDPQGTYTNKGVLLRCNVFKLDVPPRRRKQCCVTLFSVTYIIRVRVSTTRAIKLTRQPLWWDHIIENLTILMDVRVAHFTWWGRHNRIEQIKARQWLYNRSGCKYLRAHMMKLKRTSAALSLYDYGTHAFVQLFGVVHNKLFFFSPNEIVDLFEI